MTKSNGTALPIQNPKPALPVQRHQTKLRGMAVLNSPSLNKGSAFSLEERESLALTGLIPSGITTLENQVSQAYAQYCGLPDSVGKNLYLSSLHDRNEVLYFKLLSVHLREMIPIVNDINVGLAMQQSRHESRRPRGVYLSIDHVGDIEQSLVNFASDSDQIDLILATDAGEIFGVGDWGVGGIDVVISKLAIYTAAAGLHPSRVMPVMLDVGTNRSTLLSDPLYSGYRHQRIEGPAYEDFIDSFVQAAKSRFPSAIIQWEDLSPANGRWILDRYSQSLPMFNENIQGLGAVALAATISTIRCCGVPMRNQRVVLFGSGTVGMGVISQIRDAMVRDGLSPEEASLRFWCVDNDGLLQSRASLRPDQLPFARSEQEAQSFHADTTQPATLAEVVRRVKPTILIGASGLSGAFSSRIIADMAANTTRPAIFILSTPHSSAEATPADLITWTDGRGLIAAVSQNLPVTYKGVTYVPAKIDTASLCPGLSLGAIVARASRISSNMLFAAANAVSSLVTVRQPGSSLLPLVDDLRAVSLTVAMAVAEAALSEGLAAAPLDNLVERIQFAMWQPEYRSIQAI